MNDPGVKRHRVQGVAGGRIPAHPHAAEAATHAPGAIVSFEQTKLHDKAAAGPIALLYVTCRKLLVSPLVWYVQED